MLGLLVNSSPIQVTALNPFNPHGAGIPPMDAPVLLQVVAGTNLLGGYPP